MPKKSDTPKAPKSVYSDNEEAFLHHYFDINSPTKGNAYASALAAGYTENNAYKASARILGKHQKTLLAAALESIGGFDGRSTLRTWLTSILRFKVVDLQRRAGNGWQTRQRESPPPPRPADERQVRTMCGLSSSATS